jgi:hypothetical protein
MHKTASLLWLLELELNSLPTTAASGDSVLLA